MTNRVLPHYPVYILSKGRFNNCLTAKCLVNYEVPFHLVVEPQEADAYAASFGMDRLIILPFRDKGTGVPARNFIWEHAKATGIERHWILDDNLRSFWRRYHGVRCYCEPGLALRVAEDFTDRYENIGISGLNYYKFVPDYNKVKPLVINCRVYSCMLLLNSLSFQWRGRYNEDTDLCLQVLSTGEWCTVLLNTFLVEKQTTLKMKGGNTTTLYQGDGRLRMARSLERMWPGVVETNRRFQRPQHVIKDSWKKFDTPLKLKEGIDLSQLEPNEYGMSLVQVSEKIKSPKIQGILDDWQQTHKGSVNDA
jgi:hypothetical protein